MCECESVTRASASSFITASDNRRRRGDDEEERPGPTNRRLPSDPPRLPPPSLPHLNHPSSLFNRFFPSPPTRTLLEADELFKGGFVASPSGMGASWIFILAASERDEEGVAK